MMKKLLHISIVIPCFLSTVLSPITSIAQDNPEDIKADGLVWIDGLRAETYDNRHKIERRLIEDRKTIIKRLIDIARAERVGEKGFNNSKRMAIVLLGKYRAKEAIDFLLTILTYEDEPIWISGYHGPGQIYPAAGALVRIGIRSAQDALGKLFRTNDKKEIELCTWIISEVYGKDVAIFICTKRIEETQFQHLKDNLQKAIQLMKGEEEETILRWPKTE